jgi:hypothetical protein
MPSILNRAQLVNRQLFDPTNEAHLISLKNYLRTGNWGDVQFFAELPFVEVPITVLTKYAQHLLDVVPETVREKDARMNEKRVIRVK